ncbi:MAG: methionine biosynthesis protein MetW [Ignavibacteria bacterium]|nr:methionine biosynthesis protein MetW [Ignavibacteria bacterium]
MVNNINSPFSNDNRNYDYTGLEIEERKEYQRIAELVNPSSNIIDLGCGNGSLMQKLQSELNCNVTGVEISETGVNICKAKKLNVFQGSIDSRLQFDDNSFDFAICNVTIQMVMYPEVLLSEMKRIAKFSIISFPNFAYFKNRIDLIMHGRMPRPMLFNYNWYNTGHIHQLSMLDFESIVEKVGGLKIIKTDLEKTNTFSKDILLKAFPNLFQILPIYVLEKT